MMDIPSNYSELLSRPPRCLEGKDILENELACLQVLDPCLRDRATGKVQPIKARRRNQASHSPA